MANEGADVRFRGDRMRIILNFTVLAGAAALTGCDQPAPDWSAQQDVAVCVRDGVRVPNGNCAPTGYGGGGAWYYYSRGTVIPYYGDRASGGSFVRTSGATYFQAPVETSVSRSAAVARGGFGSSAHAFGGVGE